MPVVTTADLNRIIYRNGSLFVPAGIEDAIIRTVEKSSSSIDDIEAAGGVLVDAYEPVHGAIKFDYARDVIADAYVLFYTRRNTLIPRIALRDLAFNQKFRNLPPKIRALDLGCGTGAVVLGLIEMFQHAPLKGIKIHVDALDAASPMLQRLETLIQECQFGGHSVKTATVDLTNIGSLQKTLGKGGDGYDLMFAANVFTELTVSEAKDLLTCISLHLSENGVITVVDAQRDHMKELLPTLANHARQLGLSIYYPCPVDRSERCGQCWFWREYSYAHRSPRKVKGRIVKGPYREQLVATWLVMTKEPCSIYDDFIAQDPNLDWGPFSIFGANSLSCDSQVCTNDGMVTRLRVGKSIKRGSIVGGTGQPFTVKQYLEL
jgi:SAM-dependent methyltransferase